MFEEYIPFKEKKFRPGQEDAIRKIIDSIDDRNRFTVLNAPVGVGKSLIGYVVGKYYQEQGLNTYLSTATKILQSQYIKDFKDVKTIKGRMNFFCETEPMFTCDKGMCQSMPKYKCSNKPILKEEWTYQGDLISEDIDEIEDIDDMCPYWKQKIIGIMNPITMLNYDYLMSDRRFIQHLPYRHLLVADEAHNLEKVIMRQLETTFSPSVVEKEVNHSFKNISSILEWAEELSHIAGLYKDKMSTVINEPEKKKLLDKYEKFTIVSVLLEKDPNNWVFISDQKNRHIFYQFKPVTISQYTDMIFGVADHILLMTGTILKQDIFARDLGISDFTYIEVPSIIPPKNRPIIKSYVGSMARSSINATMPNMIAKIKMLAEKHKDEKGLIHTFTYNIAKRFQDELDDDRFMFHNSRNKENVFEAFKEDDTNKILVSPVAFEGVDFPHDQARWQCICKDPFPNIADPQISTRDSIDYGWIFRQRCLVLSQTYGRTNRSESDWSTTYLLDSRLETLLGASTLVTDYFLEALDGMNYTKEIKLSSDAYDKLTKDNSRKSHEFDREVERNILNDIEAGYNSLSSLRRAYKEFPSDAYKYIMPAIDRLFKHGAIQYIE